MKLKQKFSHHNQSRSCNTSKMVALIALILIISVNANQNTQANGHGQKQAQQLSQGKHQNILVEKSRIQRKSVLDDMDIDIIGAASKPIFSQAKGGSTIQGEQQKPLRHRNQADVVPELSQRSSGNAQQVVNHPEQKGTGGSQELEKIVQNYVQVHQMAQNVSTEVNTSYIEQLKEALQKEQVQSILVVGAVLFAILVFKIVINSCSCISFITDKAIKDAVYILFREVVIVLVCILALVILQQYDILSFTKVDLNRTIYCALLSLFVWTVLGFILTYTAQKQIDQWRQIETITNDFNRLDRIKSQYETQYYRNQQKRVQIDQNLISQIRYFVMRLGFIQPVYLPPLKEVFLRKDFNFAQYLAYSYGQVLQKFFNSGWTALIYLIIAINLFKITSISETNWVNTYIHFVIPVFFLVVFFAYVTYFKRIEAVLSPQIQEDGHAIKPEEINFHFNNEVIDPFTLYDNIPQPKYLEISNSDEMIKSFEAQTKRQLEQDEEDEDSIVSEDQRLSDDIYETVKQRRRRCCGLCTSQSPYMNVPNRHEALFMFGRGGAMFANTSLQIFYLLSILYFSAYVVYNAQQSYQKYKDESQEIFIPLFCVTFACPVLMFLIWVILIPQALSKLAIITHIEMMKDRDLIDKVVIEQKLERTKRSYRIYQVLKLIRRELAFELQKQIQDKRLRGFTKKQIIEAYQQCGGQKQKSIRSDAFSTLVRMSGATLNKQETYILLKKSISQGDRVRYKEFSQAIEQIMNDVKIDAYYLVYHMFQMFFNNKEKIQYEQLRTFFGEFVSYFEQEDIEGFLREVQFIKRGSEEIDLSELASMIRDDVESFPK